MKSLTGNFSSARGWALLLILFLGAGLFVAACGEEETPAPTTPTPPPAPPPAPEPEPTPEPPATPAGLMVSAATDSSITWAWNAVEGATGYVVQVSTDEMFDDMVLGNPETVLFTVGGTMVPFTTETSYTASDLDPETSLYVRVAAAAGTVEAPLVSGFSTHVTGMTTAVPLAPAPANLRVKARESDSIEWEWDAVEGVAGYQSQFSTTATFPEGAAGREWHDADETTRKVSNLDAESDGYLRVRTYAGTQAEPTFGAWSEGSMSSTREPPPAVPLAAPDNVEWDPSDASITLTWDRVRNAGSYEVEQREPGDDWGDASCGGGNNVVEDEECVATGLDSGTDYDFQVRAVPSDTDRYQTSEPSDIAETRTSGTAPRPTTPTTPGGMGGLNVTWKADTDSITWSWVPAAGATYEWDVLDVAVSTDANPCEDVDWTAADIDSGAEFSHEEGSLVAGNVRLFCVRSQDEDNRALSWAWGVPRPAGPAVSTTRTEAANDNDKAVTTALIWQTIAVVADFDYELKVVADPVRGGKINGAATDAKVVQAACSAGTRHLSGDSDVNTSFAETSITSGLKVHTGYLLCLRYANTTGDTGWAVPTDNAEIFTLPGRPASPRVLTPRIRTTATTEVVVWHVETRTQTNVPRGDADNADDFDAITIVYDETYDDGNGNGIERSTSTPTAAACDTSATAANGSWTVAPVTASDIDVDPTGIVITAASVTKNTDAEAKGDATTAGQGDIQIRLCVRAKNGTLNGPWVFGGAREIKRQAPTS